LIKDDDLFAVDEHNGESIKFFSWRRKENFYKFVPFIFGVDGLCVVLSVGLSKPGE
jgi:hypothetical protein